MRGGDHFGKSTSSHPVKVGGYWHQLTFVHDGKLSLTAASDDAHDPVTNRKPASSHPERSDLTGKLQPWNVLRCPRRGWIPASQLQDVGTVDASRVNPHQYFTRARLRVRVLVGYELTVTDGRCDHGRNASGSRSLTPDAELRALGAGR
jgi:hypothetical protein